MARLEFFFDCSNRWTYLAFHRIEALAAETGAALEWRPFQHGEPQRPRATRAHEAFAARKPVIASNLGGLTEAVTHGVSGLVFEPGNARALAACLRDLSVHPEWISRLRDGIPPVKTIQEEVDALTKVYQARRAGGDMPVG
jgi:glycosyltransferase involved in cell wall biosynthesis